MFDDVSRVVVPAAVRVVAGGRPIHPVWENELGGLTFQLGRERERCFVKWTPVASGIDLSQERARPQWAATYSPVPQVLNYGSDAAGSWILTSGLPGDSAASARWRADPSRAVPAIGAGLRALHAALPVEQCPFSWSVDRRRADIRIRAESDRIDRSGWHPVHRSLTLDRAIDRLRDVPTIDQLVVCHGDACAPNTLLTDNGRWSGHVDFGEMGIADRWADLAVATWSTQWNYGPGWETVLLDAYGVEPDHDRTSYYRLLWDLGP